jgi:integrase/recombinase XerD
MGLPQYFTRKELISLLSVAKKLNYKAYSIFYVVYILGLRVSEIIQLRKSDVDFTENYITIRRLKGSNTTRNLMTNEMRLILEYWKKRTDSVYFFPDLNRMWCDRSIKLIGNSARIPRKKLHMHTLKHSTAVHMLNAGVDVRTIQKALGHKNINNTIRYLDITDDRVDRIQQALSELLETPCN